MPQDDLSQILQQLHSSEQHQTRFSEDWSQGRAAYGGLVASMASLAMSKCLSSPQPLRSLMVSFLAPLPAGEVTVIPSIQRQGKNVTQASADVMSGDTLCLRAMAVFGKPRTALNVETKTSFNPAPRDSGISIADHAKRLPSFLQYFEGNWSAGGMPFSGQADTALSMWVKHRSDLSAFPNEKIIAIADIPPPVVLSHFSQPPVPASSLTWSLEFMLPAEEIEGDWFYLDFTMDGAADGYTQQSGKIYSESGQLCALSRQCMVYFG
ncbi:MAG: hypothetical protein COC19_06360 [SAR86 cluster bacterium]|uniref:Acyl-CoA thioesterase n=1 Tax=SAR86 cluster bacterium TaxID=2030880 RepID=A0A2A4MK05_9GAMM|nr:MAG: hypothetical protein COC19_06360 [SAR86 cluster bacterium]